MKWFSYLMKFNLLVQGNQQNILGTSMIPASVVVGMRPQGQNQHKNVGTGTLGRMVIGGQHMVGTRPSSPAVSFIKTKYR